MGENVVTMAADEPTTEMGELKMDKTVEARIKELDAEIEGYRAQIIAAEGALDSAEKEMDEILSEIRC